MKSFIILLGLFEILTASHNGLKPVNVSTNNDNKQVNTASPRHALPNYKKLAVLVGVDEYKYVRPAPASANNVNDLAASLKSHGYDTMVYINPTQVQFMIHGLRDIAEKQKTENYDVILFYLSGHFDAIDKDQLFFLAADCNPQGDKNNYLVSGTIPLYTLVSKISLLKPKVRMLLLDGPNNFELPGGRDGKLLINSFMDKPRNGMLLGACFSDHNSNNDSGKPGSLYTEAIINSLNTPDLNLTQAFDNVNKYVKLKSSDKSTALYNNGITDDFCFSCK